MLKVFRLNGSFSTVDGSLTVEYLLVTFKSNGTDVNHQISFILNAVFNKSIYQFINQFAKIWIKLLNIEQSNWPIRNFM